VSERRGRDESKKCPRCGKGVLVDITYRDDPDVAVETDEAIQTSGTRQVESYSCGHEIAGPRLDRTASGSDELEAERRATEETTDPL
jgi:hypothetical protein